MDEVKFTVDSWNEIKVAIEALVANDSISKVEFKYPDGRVRRDYNDEHLIILELREPERW